MADKITADICIFISKYYQRALAMDGNSVVDVESRLTKDEVAPLPTDSSDVPALTGEMKESEAKPYDAKESKKISAQYVGIITDLNKNSRKVMNKVSHFRQNWIPHRKL